MIDPIQLAQILKQIQAKNGNPSAAAQLPAVPGAVDIPSSSGASPSFLGFIGGLGDTRNDQGGVNPSMLTRLNQDFTGYQPLPWQPQPAGQHLGQQVSGGIFKLLSSLF